MVCLAESRRNEMGGAKREWERQQDLEAQATRPLLKAGAIKACDIHSDILVTLGDSDAEEGRLRHWDKHGESGRRDATREEFMDAIKSALEDTSDECPICAKYMAD
jgi:hypothetical protein